jgi:hypothetical protein
MANRTNNNAAKRIITTRRARHNDKLLVWTESWVFTWVSREDMSLGPAYSRIH